MTKDERMSILKELGYNVFDMGAFNEIDLDKE